MKILQICYKPPYPTYDGGSIGMHNCTELFNFLNWNLHIYAFETPKAKANLNKLDSEYQLKNNIKFGFIDTNIKLLDVLTNFFKSSSYNIDRFYNKDISKQLCNLIIAEKFDIIHFESLYTTPYLNDIKKITKSKTILRTANVEHLIWERKAITCKNSLKKIYYSFLAKRLKRYELNLMKSVDAISSVSDCETEYLQKNGIITPIDTMYLGLFEPINNLNKRATYNKLPISFFHLGAMDWEPNLEAVNWFVNTVWQPFSAEFSNVTLALAGKNMPEALLQLNNKNTKIQGFVNSANDYIFEHDVMLVPLLSGSGIRVKIIEGMSFGKVIISTSIGAEGLGLTHNENIIIADTPQEFKNAILKCANDLEFCKTISYNAYNYANENFSLKKIAESFNGFYTKILNA